jgi:hypothetical protein
VSALDFLSPDLAEARDGFAPALRSPVGRALGTRGAELGIEDVSLSTGKIEIRGEFNDLELDGADVFEVTPERALVLCPYERAGVIRAEMRQHFRTVDMMGALAGLRIERPDAVTLMRRLTDLDLDSLPAVGAVAHIQAYVLRDSETSFRLFFPQEYGDYVGDVVLDAAEGLE